MWDTIIELFFVFFSIGIFCFGGGYAIIPLIQREVVERGWLTVQQFTDIIAVAESTPGPISINTATFVGFRLEGLLGAAVATFGLCLPAFLIVVWISKVLATKWGKTLISKLMIGIRPVVVGLIFYAAYIIAQTTLMNEIESTITWSYVGVAFTLIALIATLKWKIHPIILIGCAAMFGIFI